MVRQFAVAAVLAAFVSGVAGAARAQEVIFDPIDRTQLNKGRVSIITGGIGDPHNTYLHLAGEMAAVLDEQGDLRILPVMGRGPIENIRDLLYLKGIDVGIVHSDVLAYLERTQSLPAATRWLSAIAKLNDEFFHVVAHKDIGSVADLTGRKVVVGPTPSAGSAISAVTAFSILGVEPEVLHMDWETAVEKVQGGELAALVYSSVRGSDFIREIEVGETLKLLPLPFNEELGKTYQQASFTAKDYPNFFQAGGAVETLQFATVMAVYNWDDESDRYRNVARFTTKLFESLEEFRKPPRHDRWQSFNPGAEVQGWARFKPAADWVARNPKIIAQASAGALTALKSDFMRFMDEQTALAGQKLQEQESEKLFKAFLRWTDGPTEATISLHMTSERGLGRWVGTIGARNVEVMLGGAKERALLLKPDLQGLPPGPHAFHLHENPDCGPADKDGKPVPGLAAGSHLFAAGTGSFGGRTFGSHLGDLPDLVVAEDGTATQEIVVPRLTMADLAGRAIMIHATGDDASGRQACGVIN